MTAPIVQQVTFDVPPDRVYNALMRSEEHAAFTGARSEISPEVGGAFSGHDGQIVGRHVELVPGRRIVQAWRVAGWPEGFYTLVRYELEADGSGTRLTLTHTGAPPDGREMLSQGWEMKYWEPMKAYFAG